MSRLRRIVDRDRIFFVTTNLATGVAPLSAEERSLVLQTLAEVRTSHSFLVLGYVIMPDHAHLLLACRTESIAKVMHQWKFKTGYAIQRRRGTHGSLWQARYFDSICRRSRDVSDKLAYIHENPVKARLALHGDKWPWSSAGYYTKTAQPLLMPDQMEFSGDPEELLWPAPWRCP